MLVAEGKTQTIVTNDNLYLSNTLAFKGQVFYQFLIKFLSANITRNGTVAVPENKGRGMGIGGCGTAHLSSPFPDFLVQEP